MGNNKAPPVREKSDLIAQKLVTVVHENGNRLLPKVFLNKKVFEELCTPWKDALVVKLLGKKIGYNLMKEKLKKVWKPAGVFDIMDIDNGFYMVKLDMEADREMVISNGPWMMFDHYLAVMRWSPEFVSPNAKVDRTTVWIRFPGLNLVYYDESFLLALASVVGTPIKVDRNTLKVERGRFARICVEIDLNQPVVGKVWVNGYWYKVSYEGLHIICSSCGCYGHLARNCTAPPPSNQLASPETTLSPVPGVEETVQAVAEKTVPVVAENVTAQETEGENPELAFNASTPKQNPGETHGDWLVVTRRKRSTPIAKAMNKSNTMTHLSNSFEKLYSSPKTVTHVGGKGKGPLFNSSKNIPVAASSFENKATKGGGKIKKRRHDEGIPPLTQFVPIVPAPAKVNTPEPKITTQRKEIDKQKKEAANLVQPGPTNRTPLQESPKQNISTTPKGTTAMAKGLKSAMHLEEDEDNNPTPPPIVRVSGGQPHPTGVGAINDVINDGMECESEKLHEELMTHVEDMQISHVDMHV